MVLVHIAGSFGSPGASQKGKPCWSLRHLIFGPAKGTLVELSFQSGKHRPGSTQTTDRVLGKDSRSVMSTKDNLVLIWGRGWFFNGRINWANPYQHNALPFYWKYNQQLIREKKWTQENLLHKCYSIRKTNNNKRKKKKTPTTSFPPSVPKQLLTHSQVVNLRAETMSLGPELVLLHRFGSG